MLSIEPATLIYVLAGVQVVGLASACLARMSEGSIRQASAQRIFLGCLALVGAATMTAMLIGPGASVLSGATMAVMVLTAVWDFGGAVL
jgi:hypothetical protein